MLQVICDRCLAVKDLPTNVAPEHCGLCGSANSLVGPYGVESRITGDAVQRRSATRALIRSGAHADPSTLED